jgi:hypothetical protein
MNFPLFLKKRNVARLHKASKNGLLRPKFGFWFLKPIFWIGWSSSHAVTKGPMNSNVRQMPNTSNSRCKRRRKIPEIKVWTLIPKANFLNTLKQLPVTKGPMNSNEQMLTDTSNLRYRKAPKKGSCMRSKFELWFPAPFFGISTEEVLCNQRPSEEILSTFNLSHETL